MLHAERTADGLVGVCDRPWRHKNLMYSDEFFDLNSIPVFEVLQERNEIIITDCIGFHYGGNCGFNVNCAKNFAPAFWADYGLVCDSCVCSLVHDIPSV